MLPDYHCNQCGSMMQINMVVLVGEFRVELWHRNAGSITVFHSSCRPLDTAEVSARQSTCKQPEKLGNSDCFP